MIELKKEQPVIDNEEESDKSILVRKSHDVEHELEQIGKSELKYFSRMELLEVLLDYAKENESLKGENSSLKTKLNDKKIKIKNYGSIAEAALGLNGVFEAAEESCRQYVDNVTALCDKQKIQSTHLLEKAQKQADKIVAQAKEQCSDIEGEKAKLLKDTVEECEKMKMETAEKCAKLMREVDKKCNKKIADTQRQIDNNWALLSNRLDIFYESHKGLMELVNQGIFNIPTERGSINET